MTNEQQHAEGVRRKPGPKPGTEAAKHGGRAAAAKYGTAFYSRIGKVGGTHLRERLGSEHFTRIGRLGGEITKQKHGREHFVRIGKIGGSRRPKRLEETPAKE
jgi:uncharacterized protein